MSEDLIAPATLQEPIAIYTKQDQRNTDPHFVDVMDDWAFKKIFGSEDSKEILITFLNHVLKGKRQITSITFSKNEHPGDTEEIGAAVIDIVCKDINGATFLIEVQKAKQKYFKDRTLFYASRLISDQAPKGKRNKWKYKLDDVYVISILEKFVLDKRPTGNWFHHVSMINTTTGKLFYDKLGFTYIELLKPRRAHEYSLK